MYNVNVLVFVNQNLLIVLLNSHKCPVLSGLVSKFSEIKISFSDSMVTVRYKKKGQIKASWSWDMWIRPLEGLILPTISRHIPSEYNDTPK